ncbi:hypothetical protein BK126_12840 [Paenibacillus sp. FSL H7-0326]|nr:hypothetical protein BK126_12840 [Paenibacillus sp. FSL H7-0326]
MNMKKCDGCFKESFSSCGNGQQWTCPHCNKDITHVKVQLPPQVKSSERMRLDAKYKYEPYTDK